MFEIHNLRTDKVHVVYDIKEVARIAQLREEEIRWALEEFGQCDTENFTIIERKEKVNG